MLINRKTPIKLGSWSRSKVINFEVRLLHMTNPWTMLWLALFIYSLVTGSGYTIRTPHHLPFTGVLMNLRHCKTQLPISANTDNSGALKTEIPRVRPCFGNAQNKFILVFSLARSVFDYAIKLQVACRRCNNGIIRKNDPFWGLYAGRAERLLYRRHCTRFLLSELGLLN